MIRFMHCFNYAEDVNLEEGEQWYREQHVAQVTRLPGVKRYYSWRGIRIPDDLNNGALAQTVRFVRKAELFFETVDEAVKAVLGNQALWAPSPKGKPGFREVECMFMNEEPQYDLLKDTPGPQIKYLHLPVKWLDGKQPELDESLELRDDDLIVNAQFWNYPPGISVYEGEDWNLGHHNREGKQSPGIKHYKTWRRINVPEPDGSILRPNKYYRYQERGFVSFDGWRLQRKGSGTPPAYGTPFGDMGNILVRPREPEKLLG